MTLAELLAAGRARRGLSLAEAAPLLGISKAHLWDLEQGRTENPRLDLFSAFCTVYGLDAGLMVLAVQGEPFVLPDRRMDDCALLLSRLVRLVKKGETKAALAVAQKSDDFLRRKGYLATPTPMRDSPSNDELSRAGTASA